MHLIIVLQLDVELLPFLTVIDKAVSACGTLSLFGPCFLLRHVYKLSCWATGPKRPEQALNPIPVATLLWVRVLVALLPSLKALSFSFFFRVSF